MELKWWLAALATAFALAGCGAGTSTEQQTTASTGAVATPPAGTASSTAGSSTYGNPTGQQVTTNLTSATGSPSLRPVRSVSGELLVKFRASSRMSALSVLGAQDRVQVRSVHEYRAVSGLQRIRLAPGTSVQDAIAAYSSKPDVEYAEPNYIVSVRSVPNDPSFASQWSLQNTGQVANSVPGSDIHATEAWDITTGDPNVYVGVIDSGVDYNHPDLVDNIYSSATDCNNNGIDDDNDGYIDDCHGIDTANHDSDPMDDEVDGHGTHVSGIIGAVGNNSLGVSGVAWHVKIVPCKFIGADGNGSVADAIECLDWIATLKDKGLNIVATNNSWGAGISSQALRDAIARQLQRGILFVAAAGNDYQNLSDTWGYEDGSVFPCGYSLPNIICVGASKANDDNWMEQTTIGSNYGRQTVDIVAPGHNILSTLPGNQYGMLTGTSMAAPHVTGTIALLNSHFPGIDWRAARNRILASGDISAYLDNIGHQSFDVVSKRRLNAARALTCSGATVTGRTAPRTVGQSMSNWHVGETLTLAVLNIDCENPNGAVTITLQPGNIPILLQDDGNGADLVAGDGIYTATWTPTAGGSYTLAFPGTVYDLNSGTVIADTITVNVDELLKPGFPVRTLHAGGQFVGFPGPVVGNVDGTPDLEILLPGYMQGPNYLWKSNGSLVGGWPLDPEGFNATDPLSVSSPGFWSMGHLSATASELQVVGAFVRMINGGSPIEVRFGTGVLLPSWPRIGGLTISAPPTLVDLDGDGLDEIFFGPDTHQLVGLHSDGSVVSGFPVQPADINFSGIGSPIAADIDLDGTPELIVGADNGSTGEIIALHADGTRLAGFPAAVPGPPSISGVGDVDGDGQPEIIATADRATSTGGFEHVLVEVSADGAVKRTLVVPSGASADALADLDGDGIPEIVLSWGVVDQFNHTEQRFMNVIHGDGTSLAGWPKQLTKIMEGGTSKAVVGDVDGDGKPDIVLIAQTALHVLGPDGTYASGFPRQLPYQFVYSTVGYTYTPIIADIDADGRNDIIVTSDFSDGRGGWFPRVWAYDLHGPAAQGPIEWGQPLAGPAHRGFYELGKNLAGSAYLATRVSGNGSVVAQGGGVDCGSRCIGLYTKGTAVTLTANAASGQTFTRWSGACAGQGNPCTVTVQKFTSAVAEFSGSGSPPGAYALTTTLSGSGTGGVASQPAGISCPASCSGQFAPNTSVTLTATPSTGSVFAGWSGACTGSNTTCSVSMTSAQSVGASFSLEPVLSVSVTGNGKVTSNPAGIDCGSACTQAYAPGTSVTLTAAANADSVLSSWTGACSGTGGPTCTITLDAARTVGVSFTLKPVTFLLTVSLAGSGTGRVTSTPAGIDCGSTCSSAYASGASIVLSAVPTASAAFTGWSGACSGSGSTCSVTLNAAASVTATFTPASTVGGSSGGSSSGGGNSGGSSSGGSSSGGGGGGRMDWLALAFLGALIGARARRNGNSGICRPPL